MKIIMKTLLENFDLYEDNELDILLNELSELSELYNEAREKEKTTGKKNKDVIYWRNKIMGIKKQIDKVKSEKFIAESILPYC